MTMTVDNSPYAGRTIVQTPKCKSNPRRPGTRGYESFEIVAKAGGRIRYEEYKAQGGRPQDLKWDLDHGYLKLAILRRERKPFLLQH